MFGQVATEMIGAERVKEIDWSHPRLESLSDAARFLYACLVDGCSEQALDTIAGVDVLWRNRERYLSSGGGTAPRRAALQTICGAVDELIGGGLLVLLDDKTLCGGWVQKPWQGLPA
jgi:hypothetical protein